MPNPKRYWIDKILKQDTQT